MICVRRSSPYLRPDGFELVDDDLHEQALAGQNRAQPLDRLQQFRELVEDLLALEAGQPLQLHVEDRLRLNLREAEARHQAVARFGHGLRSANQLDHLVEVIERDPQAFEDVIPRLGLAQLEFGPPADDLAPELDEALDELEQGQHLRPPADDREHDDAEARLQRRVLVEVVENHLRHFAALQLDDDAHAFAIGFVAKVGDALDHFLAHQIGDALDQRLLVDLIRNLGDDDRDPVALLVGLDRRPRAHLNRAASGRARLHARPRGRRCSRRWGSRARDQLDQLLQLSPLRETTSSASAGRRCVFSISQMQPSMTSRRLCGGTLVAMPTAMPAEPLTRRFGNGAGSTVGSSVVSS